MARYAAAAGLTAALAFVAAGWLLGDRVSPAALRGLALGGALATAGAIAGMALVAWSFGKSERVFLSALVAGMLGRLFVYGAVLVYVALRTALDPIATATGLLGIYLLLLVLEVRFAVRGLKGRGTQGRGTEGRGTPA